MISFDQACDLLGRVAQPLGTETVPLELAHRRILARPVAAAADSPPEDRAAMDGYAVRSADLPGRLLVQATSFPGSIAPPPLEPGSAVRVFTGAPLPAGADRVVIQEQVTFDGGQAVMPAAGPLAYIRRRGFDFRAGDELLAAGQLLTPRALVAAAAADVAALVVWRRPRVALIATGDELAAPGDARRRPGAIPDSVSLGVA
ncbi:MAG: molybdopterin molybdenumtransferase MoeA, partial [Cypionkella sp.]